VLIAVHRIDPDGYKDVEADRFGFFTSFRRLSVDWMADNGPSQRIGPTFPRFFPTANEFIAIGPISELFRLRFLDIKLANVAADNDVLKLREKWSIKKLGRINSGQSRPVQRMASADLLSSAKRFLNVRVKWSVSHITWRGNSP
jgi:hypothetical protein